MGPLRGIRILDLGGIGPVPFAGMILADLGADVVRIVRPSGGSSPTEAALRGRRTIDLDLKTQGGRAQALELLTLADASIESYRPGVMERLGLGPADALSANPRLIYARASGWGREGPMSALPGHDINYVALSGTLSHIRRPPDNPVSPPALIGDFGGAGMLLAIGVLAGLLEMKVSGEGQVVDTSILDGAASLMAMFWVLEYSNGSQSGSLNLLDTSAPFYEVYECSDGKYITVGALESRFFDELLRRLEIDPQEWGDQNDKSRWPDQKLHFAQIFRGKTRSEWCDLLGDLDVCFAPVLDFDEALVHPHNIAWKTFCEVEGIPQPAPSPRFDRTPSTARPHEHLGDRIQTVLEDWRSADRPA